MLNSVIITGRIATDLEIHNSGNHELYTFRVACQRTRGRGKSDFFDVLAFDKTGQFVNNYMAKGDMITVQGRLQNDLWVDKHNQKRTSTRIIADQVFFGQARAKTHDADADEHVGYNGDVPF